MSRSEPLVTVVIVTLNAAATLRVSLESVLNLACGDVELVIVDGGSTDGTLEIISEYESRIGRWISEPDRGLYDAMNKAVRLGRGQWYFFLGADDHVEEGFCAMLGSLKDPETIYYCNVWMPRRGIRYDGRFSALSLALRNICHQGLFYPSRVWQSHAYDLRYPVNADYALNLSCFADPQFRFEYVDQTVAVFNDETGVSQSRSDPAFDADKLRIIKTSFPLYVYVVAYVWHLVVRALRGLGLYDLAWRARMALKSRY